MLPPVEPYGSAARTEFTPIREETKNRIATQKVRRIMASPLKGINITAPAETRNLFSSGG
jgi:hypothetical protein